MTNELKQKDTRQKENTERREKKGYSVRKNNRVNQNKKEIEGEKKATVEKKRPTTKRNTNTRTRNNRSTNKEIMQFNFKKPNLKIIPLGGLQEIGKNITVFEYEDEIILVDCGLEFPGNDMLGVDLVIPDITYLLKNQEKVKGLVITHGHEDHIGAIPYILKQINIPIYATRLTVSLIKNKLEEHNLVNTTKLNIVEQGQTVKFKNMQVE